MTSNKTEPLVFIVYTGLKLDGECSILKVFDRRKEALRWISRFFGYVGKDEDDLIEEATDQGFDWTYLDDIKRDPYFYGRWDRDSLWALVNQDFSIFTEKRWERLSERIMKSN